MNSYASNAQVQTNSARNDMLRSFKYYGLHRQAEKVRWEFEDIDFSAIQKDKATSTVLSQVRSVANLEFTTYPGAMNFFREFADDMDFTQWVTMWLYEETRHPQVLMQYLSHFGEEFPVEDMSERREIFPLGRERIGTLSMNIISEMRAASWYLALAENTEEPVLQHICRLLSADEARHASGFYVYAKKQIDESDNPALERMRALEMLYVWVKSTVPNHHPAGHFFPHTDNQVGLADATLSYADVDLVDSRVCRMFSNLVGVPLKSKDGIKAALRSLGREAGVA